jgi:hypothetical protein
MSLSLSQKNKKNSSIYFTTSNGSLFESSIELWKVSNYVNEIVKENEENTSISIQLPHISLEYLIKVEEFLNIHSINSSNWLEIEKPIHSLDIYEIVPPVYTVYIDRMTVEEVKILITIADFLDIKPLVDLASIKIAILLKPLYETGDKNNIRRTLGIYL